MLGTPWGEVIENARAFIAVRDDHAASGGNPTASMNCCTRPSVGGTTGSPSVMFSR